MNLRTAGAVLLPIALITGRAAGRPVPRTQDAMPSARLVAFTNEPREPEFGEVFELRLTIRVAPDVVAFFPDTLIPAVAAVSAGPGSWTASPGPADSVDVSATYPVMGLLNGGVELPSLELWTRPVARGEAAGPRPTSDLGSGGPAPAAGLQRALISVGGVLIVPFAELVREKDHLAPRPPADVLGGAWSPWFFSALAVVGLAGAVLGWLVLSGRPLGSGHEVPLSPRSEALRELDRIRGLGWHTDGRLGDFYAATTGVLRRFSEQEEPDWGTALTSTELLARLRDRWGTDPVEDLRSAIWVAERAKFGGYRPETEAAEEHWSVVRDWIERMPED